MQEHLYSYSCTTRQLWPTHIGSRMDNLSPNDRFDLDFMDVGSVQQHCIIGRGHSYLGTDQHSGCQIHDQGEKSTVESPGCMPICIPHSTQLPHNSSRGNRSLQPILKQCMGYVNPPWCLIQRILSQVKSQQVQVFLPYSPVWRGDT